MRRAAAAFPAAVLASALLVYLAGVSMAPPAGRSAVLAGVLAGAAFQLLLFVLAVTVFPGKPLAAYGVGMIGRLLLVVVAALVVVPATGLASAPFLFSLVSVLFATTLLEPVLFTAGSRTKS